MVKNSYNKNMDKLSRAKGMLLGLAAGDALGAPVEFGFASFEIADQIERYKDFHDNGPQYPSGVWTDDTSMALCLADSLLEKNGYDSYDVMDRYVRWRDYGENSYFPIGVGIGIQIDYALTVYDVEEKVVHKDKEREWNAGNGAIMRLAPIILSSYDMDIKDVMKLARISARETHYSLEAEAGAEIFGAMLYLALHGKDKSEMFDLKKYSTGEIYDSILSRILEARTCGRAELQDLVGYIVDSLKVIVWGFYNFDSFEEGMLEVLKLGGDADTTCAIYGQLAGAFYGIENIPERWLGDNLYESKKIENLAEKLIEMGTTKIIRTRFEEDAEFENAPKKC